jgi:DNA-binding CsgD family transcriptional regulator
LCHNNSNGILEDKLGNVWVSTGKGIARIDPSRLYNAGIEYLAQEEIKDLAGITNYSKNDGLQGHVFNLNASEKLSNDTLQFGGPGGINVIDPTNIPENRYVFPVKIKDIKLYNKSILNEPHLITGPIEYMKGIVLGPKQNYLTIDFREICFTSPEEVTYQYILEGFDADWIYTDAAHNNATYTGLKSGKYVFKVKGSNADGHWGDRVSRLEITIIPPWWGTLIFKGLLISLIAFLLILLYLLLLRHYNDKKQKALQQQKEHYEKEKLKADLAYKNRELTSTTMHMLSRNEKLAEIRGMLAGMKDQSQGIDKAGLNRVIMAIDAEIREKDNWEQFEQNFNTLDNDFIKRLAESYPALSHNDIKICTYMRMNLSSKEIAGLLNITPKSLETSRMRIRRKIHLDPEEYLSHFILRF